MRLTRPLARLALLSLPLLSGCDGFDKESAALQIREKFCGEWRYGCSDSTQVQIKKVRKTAHGRSVDFRVMDRADETATLSAAYFEPEDDAWALLLFENPFLDVFKEQVSQLGQDRKQVSDRLMKLRTAQNWHSSIYGQYASEFEQLTRVNYKPASEPIEMVVGDGGSGWRAESSGSFVTCVIDAEKLLPVCGVRASRPAGEEAGPLTTEFGAEQ